MPTYILLTTLTAQGVQTLKSNPARLREVNRDVEELGGAAVLLARPPDESLDDVEPLIERALAEAEREGVHGQAVTPFVLAYLHRESGGRTLHANKRLIADNAALAAEVAVALAALDGSQRRRDRRNQ